MRPSILFIGTAVTFVIGAFFGMLMSVYYGLAS